MRDPEPDTDLLHELLKGAKGRTMASGGHVDDHNALAESARWLWEQQGLLKGRVEQLETRLAYTTAVALFCLVLAILAITVR